MVDNLDIIIANSTGQTVNVPYKSDEPISYLIQRIGAAIGTNKDAVDRQELYINGMRIKDDEDDISYYRIFGNTLTYRVRPMDDISVEVIYIHGEKSHRSVRGETHTLICHPNMLVQDLKALSQQRTGAPVERQHLVFCGKEHDNKSTLHSCGIKNDSVVHMATGLRRPLPSLLFLDAEGDPSGNRKILFSRDAPRGWYADPGINIEFQGACTPAYKVIHAQSFGTFEFLSSGAE
ncbi:hypothetical protein BGX29_001585 [Mortierella sp. GBA35]|nr:hypothetical protein BGX29_001585 [Mortierella sp. GBA35]